MLKLVFVGDEIVLPVCNCNLTPEHYVGKILSLLWPFLANNLWAESIKPAKAKVQRTSTTMLR